MSTAVKPVAETTITMPQVDGPVSEAGAVLQIIERAARDPSVDIGKMRELLAMRKDMMAFEAERAFDAAMTAAQTEMRPIAANADNPQTRSRYATFDALDKALRPIYTKLGFSLSWSTGEGAPADHVRIVCRVAHNAGHRQMYHLDMPADGKGAKGGDVMTKTHATGAALTYGRRYLEGMIFNIAISKDDDGNSAGNPALTQTITADQFTELRDLLEQSGSQEKDMLAYVKAQSMEDMTIGQYATAKAAMVQKIARKKGGK
jgi:hypothetical protein